MNNQQEHAQRVSKYNPQSAEEALRIIANLKNSDFNNYGQMVKDIILICKLGLDKK